MSQTKSESKRAAKSSQAGFTLLESLMGIAILLIVGGVVMSAMAKMMKVQTTVQNRTEMHSNIRNATELLAQEIGQAGRIPPFQTTMTTAVGAAYLPGTVLPAAVTVTVSILDTTGMFVGEYLQIDAGTNLVTGSDLQESVQVTAFTSGTPGTITAVFTKAHAAGVPARVVGDFPAGVVPPNFANGSGPNVLKLFGDINGDGTLVYVEYDCNGDLTGTGTLTRSVTLVTPGVAALSQAQVLLDNVALNPVDANGTRIPCFSYQPNPLQQDSLTPSNTYVFDVAVTLTVQTQTVDQEQKQAQRETKALLNIAPRNVFEAWQAFALSAPDRVQPMPGISNAPAWTADPGAVNIFSLLPLTPQPAY